MRSMFRALVGAAALALATTSLAGCGSKSGSSDSAGVTTVTIGIAAPVAQYALPAIADAEHLWPKGIKVKWSVLNAGTITSSIATGKIQMALGSAPQYDVAAYTAHTKVAWIANFQDPADFQMIARPGINSVSDLKGKVVAITAPGSSTQYLSQAALFKAGLKPGDYKLSPLGSTPAMVSAVVGGTAQALVLPSSVVQPLLKQIPGSKMVYDFYDEKVPWLGGGVIAYTPWASSHSAATVAVLKGLNAALGFVHSNPTDAEPIVSKFAATKDQAAADLQFKYLVDRTPTTLQPVKVSTLKSIYATIRDANDGDGPTDSFADSFYDNKYVEQAVS